MDCYEAASLARSWAKIGEETAKRSHDQLRWWEKWLLRILRRHFKRVLYVFGCEIGSISLKGYVTALHQRLDTEVTPTPIIRVTGSITP